MRPIKYKCHLKDTHKEVKLLSILFDEGMIAFDDGCGIYDTWNIEHFILREFTGLLDKNGKEIYEGDIIRDYIPPSPAHPSTGKLFFDGSEKIGPVEWSDIHHGYIIHYPPFGGQDRWESMHGHEHNLEVIGNIYENPSILIK